VFEIDFAGFCSNVDSGRNLFALQLLREHGIDHLFYAVTGLAEKNPNFKQQFAERVSVLRLVHVATPALKNVAAGPGLIVVSLSLHQGYDGVFCDQGVGESGSGRWWRRCRSWRVETLVVMEEDDRGSGRSRGLRAWRWKRMLRRTRKEDDDEEEAVADEAAGGPVCADDSAHRADAAVLWRSRCWHWWARRSRWRLIGSRWGKSGDDWDF